MMSYLKQFWAVLVSLAAVGGLYVGAKAVNLTYIFWIVIPISAVIVGAPHALRGLGELSVRVRNYPSLLQRVGEAQRVNAELEAGKQQLTEQVRQAAEQGRLVAFRQVQGSLSSSYGEPPTVIAIADEGGELAIVGRYLRDAEPVIGAWYTVVTAETGISKGVVQITRLEKENQRAWMHCVEPTVPEFWRHLAERALYDEAAPRIILIKYQVDWPIGEEVVADRLSDSNSSEVKNGK
jgi:hypothetical protein